MSTTIGTQSDELHPGIRQAPDVDWLVIGSGFGGSVAALRLAEKGYRVTVVEQGRRYGEGDLPGSLADRRSVWAPRLGLHGVMRLTPFRHVVSAAQTGVGGGSLIYGGVLYRALEPFFRDAQWRDLGDWEQTLAPYYSTAEWMLGARDTPWESVSAMLTREVADHFGGSARFTTAPIGVFFGEPNVTVEDPYFGGAGPPRTGCIRCGQCMVGCRTGAVNNLTKNYLWFAETSGARILAECRVVDVTPLGAPDGRDGYRVVLERSGALSRRGRDSITARGVVFAGGTVGTNQLLANCKHTGSLPRISDHLGELVRTNSEVCLAVSLPEGQTVWRDVTTSSRVVLDGDTQIELLTYGPYGDLMRRTFTALAAGGPTRRRMLSWLRAILRHPGRFLATTRAGWSSHSLVMLVMQARDNALRFRARRRQLGRGYVLTTERDAERPAPAHLEIGDRVATWLAERTGGAAQASSSQVFGGAPTTAHLLGGAVIGVGPGSGVVNRDLQVFGYHNMIVCDGAAMPANPGVNPALTITALAEHAMAGVPRAPWHAAPTETVVPPAPASTTPGPATTRS